MKKGRDFKLLDFIGEDVVNMTKTGDKYVKNKVFQIQMFGKNEEGTSAAITVKGFEPFFYIKVGLNWNEETVRVFEREIKQGLAVEELRSNYKAWQKGRIANLIPSISKKNSKEGESAYVRRVCNEYKSSHEKGMVYCKLVHKKKLYGFDNHTVHNFVEFKFKTNASYNKVKNRWFTRTKDATSKFGYTQLLKTYLFNNCNTELYEAKLPPLLRFFHINNISPSGWIHLPKGKYKIIKRKATYCDFEFSIESSNIIPLPNKESAVPLKICSFDIEASSSHGDFPLPKKTYEKLAGELQTFWTTNKEDISKLSKAHRQRLLLRQIKTAFGLLEEPCDGISQVFPKEPLLASDDPDMYIDGLFASLVKDPLKTLISGTNNKTTYKSYIGDDDDIIHSPFTFAKTTKTKNKTGSVYTIVDCLLDDIDSGKKLELVDFALSKLFPALKGDKITYIGSTFIISGEEQPYLNHGACLNTCTDYGGKEVQIVECESETRVLLEWTKIIKQQQPDVIIGYNIFGFDYRFMCDRAEELDCEIEFYKLGRLIHTTDLNNKDEDWYIKDIRRKKRIEKEIRIASGTHELTYIYMEGILQLDLYNYFRREINLASYKLQDVGSYFIGDMISSIENGPEINSSIIKSKNLMGLQKDNYVIFEVIGHSLDPYENGKKFKVIDIDEKNGQFVVDAIITLEEGSKKRWGLGKDDVSVQDLFRLTNGTADDRQIIARYCFQDCNLVHHLMRKNDILTGMTQIASICFVPIDYIIMRGQGIKLLSFIAKKCNEQNTLMPVLDRAASGGYEGAICLPPQRDFYSDTPVAVVDYASLYPSSMISENISHDSKVWSKEYDNEGLAIGETGIKNDDGEFIYDNLEGFKYVDIEYDTYDYLVKPGKTKEEKTKIGTKICRYAQFPNDEKGIMPNILQELLSARKSTRELIKYKTLELSDDSTISGLLKETELEYCIKNKTGSYNIDKTDVVKKYDTYNDFMKNIFNQRQLGYKVTANSLYGQCGAKTSSFFEMDIAASTTAIGRKLLIYAKKVIEGVYQNKIIDTEYGKLKCNAKVVYGDTDSCFFTFNNEDLDGNKITGKKALDLTIKLAIEAGQLASKFLKSPHDLEYEKTFMPFLLLSKKRYVGIQFEHDLNKSSRKSMGIVLKRRDNADIVKDVYGGVIDILMKDGDVGKAVKFTKMFLQKIIDGNVDIKKLIISKAIRGWYKNPKSIAHKVLADRMGKRDPGNKPAIGSRIPYIYIQTKGNVKLQGDKIEHPDYIKQEGLKPDYMFYITNQIMKPLQQIFALVLEQIPEFKSSLPKFKRQVNTIKRKYAGDNENIEKAEDKIRNAEVKKLIFNEVLRQAQNEKLGQQTIESFFG